MKTHVKTGVLIFFLTVLSVAGIQPGKAKADSIKIAGNMVLNEVKDVDIEGHHYEAILFRVSQNVANNETYAILQGLKSNENSLVIPAYIEGIPVKEITKSRTVQCNMEPSAFHTMIRVIMCGQRTAVKSMIRSRFLLLSLALKNSRM